VLTVLATRTTPINDDELLALPIAGASITLNRRGVGPGATLKVVRGHTEVHVVVLEADKVGVPDLAPAAAAAVDRAWAPGAAILDRGYPELARDVAVSLAELMQGAIEDGDGYLGRPHRVWPREEAASRPLRPAPPHTWGRDHAMVYVLPTLPQEELACWGDLTRQLPEALDVVPGPGGTLTGPDDVLLGVAKVVRDNARVYVEVHDPSKLSGILFTDNREDPAFKHTVERALSHGAPIVSVTWSRDVPGEEAVAWGVLALVMERWGGVPVPYPVGKRERVNVYTTPEAARAESRRLDPDLDWTPARPPPPPSVRWASTGGVVFDEPVVIPRDAPPGAPPKAVFIASMRVFPTRQVVFTTEELTEALGVVVKHGSLGPTRGNIPWIATLSRGRHGVMFVQSPFPYPVHELLHATFDDATRGRVEHLRTTANPLGCGPSILEIHVDLIDPLDVAIAYDVAVHLAELTEGVVAADHPMLLPRAGRTYTAAELRAITGVQH
jgi:hypothetical protein